MKKYFTKREITKKETRKYSTSTYLTALLNRTVKKELRGGECQRQRNEYIYLKQKKENSIKTMVLKIYL